MTQHHAPTVTSNIYLDMLQLYAVPQFPEGVIFQQNGTPPHYGSIVPKSCSSNSDCFHGGNCTKNGTCSCPTGTNGTLCENAVECIKHPEMCGNGTDVKCVFNVKTKYTMCQCDDKKKMFNHFDERCA
ncbi:hypothetical protein AVEN_7121-1, partial [Araneus ventricosus]